MFTAASFIIAKNWNQLNVHQQVNGKQIVMYLYTETTLSNKIELTIDMWDSPDESHSNYVEIKNEAKIKKRISTAWFNLYKVLENANYSTVTDQWLS